MLIRVIIYTTRIKKKKIPTANISTSACTTHSRADPAEARLTQNGESHLTRSDLNPNGAIFHSQWGYQNELDKLSVSNFVASKLKKKIIIIF